MADAPMKTEAARTESARTEADDQAVGRLTGLAKALSDPTRLRMLRMMAAGRPCCAGATCAPTVPADEATKGICVCEFQYAFGLGQSRISYHLKVLKETGLVDEETRGKWTFYSLNQQAARELGRSLEAYLRE